MMNDGVVNFKYNCLRKIINSTKVTLEDKEKNIKGKHKKFYDGKFDVSDIYEMVYLVVTEVFCAIPDDDQCISVGGVKSELPIKDGCSLIKNISYFLDKLYNLREVSNCQIVTESELDRKTEEDNDIPLIDMLLSKDLLQTRGEISRNRVCANVLRLIQSDKNRVFGLFNSDSTNVKAVIRTFLERKETFIYGNGFFEEVSQEELSNLIQKHTDVFIHKKNLAQCVRTIKTKLLNHLFLVNGKHIFMFCLDDEEMFNLCSGYRDWRYLVETFNIHTDFVLKWKKQFDSDSDEIRFIRGNIEAMEKSPDEIAKKITEEIVNEYLQKESEKIAELTLGYKVDDRFAGNKMKFWDLYISQSYADFYEAFKNKKIYIPEEMKAAISDSQYKELKKKFPDKIVDDISGGVRINYVWDWLKKEFPSFFRDDIKDKDNPRMLKMFDMWKKAEQEMKTNRIKLTFYSGENVKHSIKIKMNLKDVTIYEGFTRYLLCDNESMMAYVLPKERRKKIKINRRK